MPAGGAGRCRAEKSGNVSTAMSMLLTGNGPRAYFSSGLAGRQVPFTEIPVIDFAPMFAPDRAAR